MPTKPHIILIAGGTPPTPPPPDGAAPCHECGNCVFSQNSFLAVTKTAWLCNDGDPSATTISEDWPFESASASAVNYKLDPDNYASYNCTLRRWQITASGSSFDTTGICIFGYQGTLQLDACEQVIKWHLFNDQQFEVFRGIVMLNNCVPSIAV